MEQLIFLGAVLIASLSIASGLECYVCQSQDNNRDKCIKTTKQCLQEEEICYSRIRWAVPPYWVPHADRIHYIWKDCASKDWCNKQKDGLYARNYCKRDWFNDWECMECCNGDLCNYYVTLDASISKANALVIMLAAVAYALARRITLR